MKVKISLIEVMLICITFTSYSQNQIIGKWLSADKEGITEIYQQSGKYFGKIIWLKNQNDNKGNPYTDTENPNKLLKNRPLIELIIIKDLRFNNNEWKDGTIYDPESGKTYNCTIWLTSYNTLKVRGYWGIFYQSQTWTKTK